MKKEWGNGNDALSGFEMEGVCESRRSCRSTNGDADARWNTSKTSRADWFAMAESNQSGDGRSQLPTFSGKGLRRKGGVRNGWLLRHPTGNREGDSDRARQLFAADPGRNTHGTRAQAHHKVALPG